MDPSKGKPDVKDHYTNASEESFKDGLWTNSHVTDTSNLTAQEAIEKLGIKSPPDKIIPIKDGGNFVEGRRFIVQEHPLGLGGGTDYINQRKVPAKDILPAIPINE